MDSTVRAFDTCWGCEEDECICTTDSNVEAWRELCSPQEITDVEFVRRAKVGLQSMATEILHLRRSIRKHMEASGHNLCWENDQELWRSAFGPDARSYPHSTVPPYGEFIGQCSKYWKSRSPAKRVHLQVLGGHQAFELLTPENEPRYIIAFQVSTLEDSTLAKIMADNLLETLSTQGIVATACILPTDVDLDVLDQQPNDTDRPPPPTFDLDWAEDEEKTHPGAPEEVEDPSLAG